MKRRRGLLFLLGMVILLGCSSQSSLERRVRPYRDPITYSFEAYTPAQTEKDALQKLLTGVQETSRQIREQEKKYLW